LLSREPGFSLAAGSSGGILSGEEDLPPVAWQGHGSSMHPPPILAIIPFVRDFINWTSRSGMQVGELDQLFCPAKKSAFPSKDQFPGQIIWSNCLNIRLQIHNNRTNFKIATGNIAIQKRYPLLVRINRFPITRSRRGFWQDHLDK
jgi:hypothetical protein